MGARGTPGGVGVFAGRDNASGGGVARVGDCSVCAESPDAAGYTPENEQTVCHLINGHGRNFSPTMCFGGVGAGGGRGAGGGKRVSASSRNLL